MITLRIQAREDTLAQWVLYNPRLSVAEFGFESDTGMLKIGDGVTYWNDLEYFTGNPDETITWRTPDHALSDYTGSGSLVWTVAAGDVTTYAYVIRGRTMTVSFHIVTSTTTGTASNILMVKIPLAKQAAKVMQGHARIIDDGGAAVLGYCQVDVSGTVIQVFKADQSNYSAAATDTTEISGQITFEII